MLRRVLKSRAASVRRCSYAGTWRLSRAHRGAWPGFAAGLREGRARGLGGCGDFELGFVRTACRRCGDVLRVPFACKSRGFCPSCMGRRMAEKAALLERCPMREPSSSPADSLTRPASREHGASRECPLGQTHRPHESGASPAWRSGAAHADMRADRFLARLCALVPRTLAARFRGISASTSFRLPGDPAPW
ncbi:transposase zinc-binding domain-containing protein [Nannocystis sp. ILAH1]|uniref:transposase zinc-binding domain-containing protein n=1 Tax=Nannocystis sp. ILAH1 TaxID=2996789 RepID=UPI00320A26DF